jgi:hypothetical protein
MSNPVWHRPDYRRPWIRFATVTIQISEVIRMHPGNIVLAMSALRRKRFFYVFATVTLAYATQALSMTETGYPERDPYNSSIRRPIRIGWAVTRVHFGAIFSALMSFPPFVLLGMKSPQIGVGRYLASPSRVCVSI